MFLDLTKIKTRRVYFTPEIAYKWVRGLNYPLQRKVMDGRVAYLRDLMLRGEFYAGTTLTIALQQDTHQMFLVNGQHTLRAIAYPELIKETGKRSRYQDQQEKDDTLYAMQLRVDFVPTTNKAETAALYNCLDRNRPRSFADAVFNLFETSGLGQGSEIVWGPERIKRMSAALTYMAKKFPNRSGDLPNQETKVMLPLAKMLSYGEAYFKLASGASPKKMIDKSRSRTMLALGLATLSQSAKVYGEDKVSNFWWKLYHEDFGGKDDPINRLQSLLMGTLDLPKDLTLELATQKYEAFDNLLKCLFSYCFDLYLKDRKIVKPRYMEIYGKKDLFSIPGYDMEHPFGLDEEVDEIILPKNKETEATPPVPYLVDQMVNESDQPDPVAFGLPPNIWVL